MSLRTLLLLGLVATAAAHSVLTRPIPDSPSQCRVGYHMSCEGPCDMAGKIQTEDHYEATATYARGERVEFAYARNNHANAGFVRLSLVPRHLAMDKEEHDNRAFHYSCWGATTKQATKEMMVKDDQGYSIVDEDDSGLFFVTEAVIPSVIPNGIYVLGWSWYGGVEWDKFPEDSHGFFTDYYSCALVRIMGGPEADTYDPVFHHDVSEFNRHYSPEGCISGVDALDVCLTEPCVGSPKATYRKPRPFANGNTPRPITREMYFAEKTGREAPAPSLPDPTCARGKLADFGGERFCCAAGCPKCGGPGCIGGDGCCISYILRSGIKCDESGAPCIVQEPKLDPKCEEGVLSVLYHPDGNDVCCPGTCGECGGDRCGFRIGGGACCHGSALRDDGSERYCDEVEAPCIVKRG